MADPSPPLDLSALARELLAKVKALLARPHTPSFSPAARRAACLAEIEAALVRVQQGMAEYHDPLCSEGTPAGDQTMPCDCGFGEPPLVVIQRLRGELEQAQRHHAECCEAAELRLAEAERDLAQARQERDALLTEIDRQCATNLSDGGTDVVERGVKLIREMSEARIRYANRAADVRRETLDEVDEALAQESDVYVVLRRLREGAGEGKP